MAKKTYKNSRPKKPADRVPTGRTSTAPPIKKSEASFGRKRTYISVAAVLVVIVIAVSVILVVGIGSQSSGVQSADAVVMPIAYDNTIQDVTPRSMFISSQEATGLTPPAELPPKQAKLLETNGKLDIYYFGGEYCGGCAGLSWPIVEALAKFGTFHNLAAAISSPKDTMPDVAGASFVGTTYTSKYINFFPVELYSNQQISPGKWQPLQSLTPEETKLMNTWDKPPYTATKNSLPFLLVGGKYFLATPGYDPSWLAKQGIKQTVVQAAAGSFPTTMDLQAQAGHIIGSICLVLHNSAPVCKGIPASLEKFVIPVAFNRETPPS
ncbi:MAG: DUF929 family protein [Firmicutes bacterium]|jgi:hypothetical protein|nr:DUF929 family protein [Bacillota bacterium]